jgi:glycyl-tRNA synthetase
VHDRGDWDLSRHTEFSGKELAYTDPETRESYTPMVIESSMGVDRVCLALLVSAYEEEDLGGGDSRTVMHFAPHIAPVKVAVLPLSKKLAEPAKALERELRRRWSCSYDASGNIGRRYRRQDEAGTPFCVTYDFDSVDDDQVTVRERDSMEQERVAIETVVDYLGSRLESPQ